MTYFEYTKYGKEFLITRFEDGTGMGVRLRFNNVALGSVQIGARSVRLENGVATLTSLPHEETVLTPILHTETGSFLCDRIKVLAGKAAPLIELRERVLDLTGRLISADERINALENKITELCSKVYAKSIF